MKNKNIRERFRVKQLTYANKDIEYIVEFRVCFLQFAGRLRMFELLPAAIYFFWFLITLNPIFCEINYLAYLNIDLDDIEQVNDIESKAIRFKTEAEALTAIDRIVQNAEAEMQKKQEVLNAKKVINEQVL